MWKIFAIVVVAAFVVVRYGEAMDCYTCVTLKPSWALEKCKTEVKKNCVFCTKATFGNSLTIRGCATAGTVNMYTADGKICSTYKSKFKNANEKKKFGGSCDKDRKNRDPKKGYACKKKLCNGATSRHATRQSVFAVAGAIFFSFRLRRL